MSTPLSVAINARLSGTETLTGAGLAAQQALAALLGTDDTGGPAVIQGNANQAVVYPCITFRVSGGVESLRGHDFGRRVQSIYDLEIWENRGLAETVTDIDHQVELLLDMRFHVAPVLPLTAGRCYWVEALTELDIQYDNRINAWFGLRRYAAVEGRVA